MYTNMWIIKSVAGAERCGATESVEFFTLPVILLSEVIKAFFPGSVWYNIHYNIIVLF
jgi:hypothetical protein